MRQGRPSRREHAAWQERKARAAQIFEAGGRQADVVRELGIHPDTASRWHRLWREGGRERLGQVLPPGPAPLLSQGQLEELEQHLLKGPEHHGYATSLWTLPRIAKLIEDLFGVSHHPGRVWHILRKMGWSCQKPQRQAKERNEAAIARWVKEDWPRIKRGQKNKEP